MVERQDEKHQRIEKIDWKAVCDTIALRWTKSRSSRGLEPSVTLSCWRRTPQRTQDNDHETIQTTVEPSAPHRAHHRPVLGSWLCGCWRLSAQSWASLAVGQTPLNMEPSTRHGAPGLRPRWAFLPAAAAVSWSRRMPGLSMAWRMATGPKIKTTREQRVVHTHRGDPRNNGGVSSSKERKAGA